MNLKAFPRQHRQINRTSLRLIVLAILLLLIVNLLPANPFDLGVGHVSAAPLPPAQFFYVPLPEAQVRTSMYTINSATGNNMHTVLGISITANSTVVWYDHWEDGYELALGSPAQASTRIWGDGNVGNGDACALAVPATLCSGDVLSSGAVLILENNVPLPRNPATILYDGRDKIGANKVVAVTQSGWEQTPATLLADAIEVIDVSRWSTEYRLPIGENLSASSYQVFEYVSLFVMASQNGTTVQIDRDGNGSIDITTTLNQGESYQLTNPTVGDLTSNARITSSKPVQVNLVTGDIGSNYENRWFAISPNTLWDSSYYTAVGTVSSAYAAHVWVFNPDQSSAITVNYTTQAGSGSFNVPAKSTYRFAMPSMTGAHFYTSGAPFLAVGTMDSGSTTTSKNQTYDWGYTLLPESFLTNVLALGWAPGSDDKYAPPGPDENTSPVWVTAVAPARVYVDFDGNPSTGPLTDPSGRKYDIHYDLGAFQSQRVYDTSGDNSQTGMRLYTLDGTLITAAWGEDPTTAKPGSPGMDIGYSVPPLPRAVAKKTWSLYADNVGGNGVVDPGGDELEYAITAKNNGAFTIFNTIISDTVPSNVTYVLNSTEINNLAYPDDGVGTPYPLDEGGINLGALNVGQTAVVTFRVTTNAGLYSEITNTAYVETDDDFLVIELRTPVNTPATTACTLDFTNSSFSPVSFYVQNGTVYLEVDDGDQNLNTGVIENVSVLVQDPTTGDRETIALSETDVNTGLFRGSIPSSTTLGQAVQDGTLHALGGDTITADYTDPLYGDACNDTAVITVPSLTKQLYLSTQSGTNPTNNGNQELDRIDPVASADGTTALSPVLGTSSGTITVDGAATSGVETVDSTINFNHTTGNGANRLMLVGVAYECSGSTCAVPPTLPTPSVSSVTFNTSFNLSLVGRAYNSVDAVVEIWAGFNPPANITNGPIVVTMSDSSVDAAAGAITYANVDPGQTLTFFGNVGNGGTLQRTGITSAAGELVFDTVAWDDIPAGASTPGSGQSSPLWTANAGTNGANAGVRSSASTKPGASPSVTMSWTPSTGDWAIGAVSIKPAPAGVTSTSFTQTPDMAKPFSMPVGGQVSVNAHVNIISGSMPANPNITAVLKYGATTFATLTNPTYSGGIVTWTGVLGSNVTTPAGQSIILEITTNQAGVTFQIRYDSTTYPSKVNLPTTTVIKVDSLTVYDAAYAGGSSISNGFNGQTVYIRPVVSDPFGAYDITDVALTIKQPASCGGATVVSTVLTDSNVVTPNPIVGDEASKTYEYVWATPGSCEGEYSIQVVTHEGLEATITDSSTLLFDVRFEDVGTPSTTEFTDGDNGPGAEVYDPDEQVCVRVTDADQNQDPGVAETVDVVITSASGDSETVTLTETDVDTGVFTGCIPADSVNPGTDEDGELYAQPGDNLLVTYEDPNDPSDTSSDTAVVRTLTPQIAINKVLVDPASGPALVGQTVRFDILVSNPGPTQLTTVGLVDTFDDVCFDFDSASVAPNGTTSSTLTWTNIGPLAANGGSTTISVYFTATAACNPANNSAQASGTDQFGTPVGPVSDPATVVISTIDIEITKTLISPNPGPATVGDPVTFTIIVTNTGLITLETIPLEDSYSNACLNFSSASPTPDGAGGGIIQWYDITGGGSLTTGNSVALTVGFVAA
ncbi:MAG: DUF11 domain-containing protein, partial [Caldilineales bacterium]|nr:DUF11 domain-containing protein [Caldilineales bacterium]